MINYITFVERHPYQSVYLYVVNSKSLTTLIVFVKLKIGRDGTTCEQHSSGLSLVVNL